MDDDEDHITQPSSQHRDEQKAMSAIDTTSSKEEEKLTSNRRRRTRVKFAYSFDKEPVLPITQTAVIKTEPCFKVIAKEDQSAKEFYQNKPKEKKKIQLIERRTSFESDSLEEEYPPRLAKEKPATPKIINAETVPHQTPSSLPIKSILKKPKMKDKEQTTTPKLSPSLSSSKKQIYTSRLDFNEVQHLAEIAAKQNLTSPSVHSRSLFDQTINIFNPDYSYRLTSSSSRPLRFQYYMKPYRGDPQSSPSMVRARSSSLPRQSRRTNHQNRPLTRQSHRKQHVSWSPARDSIDQGKDHTIRTSTKKEKQLSANPPPQNLPPIIPVSVLHRLSPSTIIGCPEISFTSEVPSNQLRSHTSDQQKKEHEETMKRYDQLLGRIRATDEQLQSLSRSWKNTTRQRTPAEVDRRSTLTLNKMTNESDFFSPMTVQICLIILVIFNLLLAYFFNDINVWWSENIAPGMIAERHNEPIWNS